MKEIKEDTKKWEQILCSWIKKINIKISVVSKVIYRFSEIPIKILMTSFTEIEKILKFVWNHERFCMVKATLRKNKAEGITLLISNYNTEL